MASQAVDSDAASSSSCAHSWSMSEIHTVTMSSAPKEHKIQAYRQWCNSYDADVLNSQYVAFDIAAEKISRLIRADDWLRSVRELQLLDAGCGTGLCAPPLHSVAQEFRLRFRLTGLDFSEEMLQKAAQRQLYHELQCADLNHALPVAARSMHLCVSMGVFLEGHCGPDALYNVLQCLAAGGYAVISVRQKHFGTLREQFLAAIARAECAIVEQSVCAYLGPVQALYLVLNKQRQRDAQQQQQQQQQ